MPDVYVVPDGDGWKVTHEGSGDSTHDTQAEAIDAARTVAQVASCELVIHGADGKIRAKDSEGNDPRSIPG